MTHPEGPINPEIRPDQEIETKIRDVDLEMLTKNLELVGARLLTDRRLLSDRSFACENSEEIHTELPASAVLDQNKFVELMTKLGYEARVQDAQIIITGINKTLNVRLRIRKDGNDIYLTGKFKEDGHKELATKGIKQRTELEITVQNLAEVDKCLQNLGYRLYRENEKFRTSYVVDVDGAKVKVEINEGPIARVRPWVEIEAPSEEYLVKTAQLLGFNKQDFFSGSDNELYRQAGVSDEQLKVIKFSNGKT